MAPKPNIVLLTGFVLASVFLAAEDPAVALEVTGSIRVVEAEPPGQQRARAKGTLIRFISESDPQRVFEDSADAEGRYRVSLPGLTLVEEAGAAVPNSSQLEQNYPNPFNPSTRISYFLGESGPAKLEIYNNLGQRVRTLVDAWQERGGHDALWDGKGEAGEGVAAGVYLYRLDAGSFSETRKMVLADGAETAAPSPGRSPILQAPTAGKVTAGGSYRVVIDGFKLVPFARAGVAIDGDQVLDFEVQEDPRTEVVFLKRGRKELFLDTFVLEEFRELERRQHQLQKYEGNPVIRGEFPWEIRAMQTRDAPYWNPEKQRYEFRYWGFPHINEEGIYPWVSCLAVSQDGFRWEKPIVGEFEWEGSKENNMLQSPGQAHDLVYHVLYDPRDPDPQRRWKGLIGAIDPLPAASPDGLHWTLLSEQRLFGSEEHHLFYDEENEQFVFLGRSGINSDANHLRGRDQLYGRGCNIPGGVGCARRGWLRAVWMQTSKDFVDWGSDPPFPYAFAPDGRDHQLGLDWLEAHMANPALKQPLVVNLDEYTSQIYNMSAFSYEGIYIGFPTRFRMTGTIPEEFEGAGGSDGFNVTGLSMSRDLAPWRYVLDDTRPDFIPLSTVDSGQYDLAQIMPPGKPLRIGEQLVFMYTALKYRSYAAGESADMPDHGAFNLGTLRLDGFASLHAGDTEAEMITRPLVWRGSTLWVNADASDGEIAVELLDEEGNVLGEAWSLERAVPIGEDGVRLAVRWSGSEDLSAFELQSVRLRVRMQNADLYAFWSE